MDEKKLLNRVQYLTHAIFMNTAEGKEWVRLMKLLHVVTPTFPQSERTIAQHGGAKCWAAFREGQLTLLRSIDAMSQNYMDKLAAENAEGETKV